MKSLIVATGLVVAAMVGGSGASVANAGAPSVALAADPPYQAGSAAIDLPLAITKAIVEHMSGRVGFQSEPGRTTFYFDLPEWRRTVSRGKASENTWPAGR